MSKLMRPPTCSTCCRPDLDIRYSIGIGKLFFRDKDGNVRIQDCPDCEAFRKEQEKPANEH